MDLRPFADRYKISLDHSCPRNNNPECSDSQEINGKDGEIWPYSESHLVVAFFHSWRSRRSPHGKVIWIPSTRSPKAKRFQALAGVNAEVVQDCDEATCFKVPNRYLARALRMIAPDKELVLREPLTQAAPSSLDKEVWPGLTVCPSCGVRDEPIGSDNYCSIVCAVLGRAGLGWRTNPYRIVDLVAGRVVSEGPAFDLTPRGIAWLKERAIQFPIPSTEAADGHDEAA